ncbi:toprim domain-containing protein [Metamycoplasma canadense]|uniref:Recombination protein R n=1 Tax=Metamycoplasma canadense TaxID=29554 RepID=A0A077LC15_9BACT|nr:toprim domain-containing protein [Metamycoplasma canadense]BAP39659.1 recombination protein R [Metamycoplasma canadense]
MNIELKEKIIEALNKIPSVSKRQANRIITFFLESNKDFSKTLFNDILSLINETTKCQLCLSYSVNEICSICKDKTRAKKLFVVQDSQDIEKIESLDIEKGKYFVFQNLINLKKIDDLTLKKIDLFLEIVNNFNEIIFALSTDLNGQVTTKYLEKKIKDKFKNKNIYQLSIGIPFGMSIESIDPISLKQSILNKKNIN